MKIKTISQGGIAVLAAASFALTACCEKEDTDKPKDEPVVPVRVITNDELEDRNGIAYEVDQATPFTGLGQDFHSNGQKQSEVNYKDGVRHGVRTDWYKNGNKWLEMKFKDGKQHGVKTWWRENGKKKSDLNYKDGLRHGAVTEWYENGQKRSEVNYIEGKVHGLKTRWDENGVEKK